MSIIIIILTMKKIKLQQPKKDDVYTIKETETSTVPTTTTMPQPTQNKNIIIKSIMWIGKILAKMFKAYWRLSNLMYERLKKKKNKK